jgi:hypothetical protein
MKSAANVDRLVQNREVMIAGVIALSKIGYLIFIYDHYCPNVEVGAG